MSDNNFDERLRDAEVIGRVVQSNIKNISADISDLKQMFQKMMQDSVKIAELSARVQIVVSLERRVDELSAALANLSQKVVSVKSTHEVCLLGRTEEGKFLKELNLKIATIEMNYSTILIELSALTKSKGRFEHIFWTWLERIGWMVMISTFWIIVTHSDTVTSMFEKKVKATTEQTQTLDKQEAKTYKLPSRNPSP